MERILKIYGLTVPDLPGAGSQSFFTIMLTAIAAYFDSTLTFLLALVIGFAFNILAGMKADDVKITGFNIENLECKKLVDSLMELFLITGVTYMLKSLIDLFKFDDRSAYVVQILIALQLYYYLRNGLRNLKVAYPRNLWIATLYNLMIFQFRKIAPSSVVDAMDKAEKETNKI